MSENLMLRLQAFQFDPPGVALPFALRLGRENGWSPEYSRRVIAEYKRFIYLAACAGHPVSPPPAVDEVWHLHLCYTRSYWDDLCGKVLDRPFHHEPTEGGGKEAAKFEDWYARTLHSYRAHFKEAPPADIWPSGGEPKSGSGNTGVGGECWRIPKRPVKRFASAVAIGGLSLGSVGCTGDPVFMASAVFGGIVVSGIAMIIVPLVRYSRGHRPDRRGSGCGGTGFTSCGGTHPSNLDNGYQGAQDSHGSSGSHDSGGSGGGSSCGSSCGGGCGGGD